MKYLITITITRYDNPPPLVPGSVTHATMFSDQDPSQSVLRLARDLAETTVLGYLALEPPLSKTPQT
jgi:hypothetical protein